MKIASIFTDEELALIDSGKYTPGRSVLDAKLDLAAALEREACAAECERMMMYTGGRQKSAVHQDVWTAAKAIRARGNT
jgi:hypothetical protein